MTKLEEEIANAVWAARFSSDPNAGGRAAVEVVKKYIEKVWYVGEYTPNVHQLQNLYFALTGEELEIK